MVTPSTARFPTPLNKYFAAFKSGAMELDMETNDLHEARQWIVRRLESFPSPDYAVIRDQESEEIIFEERNS